MRRRRVLGLAEMMNFPGVIAGSSGELEKLGLDGAAHVDGHAPGVLGQGAAGVCGGGDPLGPRGADGRGGPRATAGGDVAPHPRGVDGAQPARAPPARRGVRPMPHRVLHRRPRSRRHRRPGHINGMVREAVAAGIAPEDARAHGVAQPGALARPARHGAIAPGYQADLLVLPDLVELPAATVLKRGRTIEEFRAVEVPDWVTPVGPDRAGLRRRLRDPLERRPRAGDRADRGSGRDRVARARAASSKAAGGRRARSATSRRSPSSSATSRRAGSGSASCPGRACSAARSPRPSPTTRTTSSSSGCRTGHGLRGRAAGRARRRNRRRRGRRVLRRAARYRSPACSRTRRSRRSSHGAAPATTPRTRSAGPARHRS